VKGADKTVGRLVVVGRVEEHGVERSADQPAILQEADVAGDRIVLLGLGRHADAERELLAARSGELVEAVAEDPCGLVRFPVPVGVGRGIAAPVRAGKARALGAVTLVRTLAIRAGVEFEGGGVSGCLKTEGSPDQSALDRE